MIPVLSAEQVREVDTRTLSNEPIASIDLMERAASGCVAWLTERYPAGSSFYILAGCGNNGGDGLAVARLLATSGVRVRVALCRSRDRLSADAGYNLERLKGSPVELLEIAAGGSLPPPADPEVVIDALLGIGLDRPLDGWLKDVVAEVNRWPNTIIAIDMPTGLFTADNSLNDRACIIRADEVLTFQVPKLALLLPENEPYVRHWQSLPIGLDADLLHTSGAKEWLIEVTDVRALMPERTRFAHKGTGGRAALIAGSPGHFGAAMLATEACARSGVGSITVQLPLDLQPVIHARFPEAMAMLDVFDELHARSDAERFTAIGVGPGMGTDDAAARLLKRLIQETPVPMVLDADALNLLAENRTWLAFLPKNTVLTPHPKEFDRLTDRSDTGYARLTKARAFAVRFGVIVVLKGANSAICGPDGVVRFNPTGNAGMAKGGSGDVLTGIITGLLAQGLPPLSAAVLGVYAHGLAGDLAADEYGTDGMLPSDLLRYLPLAWRKIRASS